MSVTTPFEPIAEVFERNLSVRHVYAEPVHHGDTTVIPVAKVAYGFGAGAGRRPAPRSGRWPARPPKPLGRKPRVVGVAVGLDSLQSGP